MTDDQYVPFGLTADEQRVRAVLVDGVPRWMKRSLVEWVADRLTGQHYPSIDLMLEVERNCLYSFSLNPEIGHITAAQLRFLLDKVPDHILLRMADFHAQKLTGKYQPAKLDRLAAILDNSSSKYELGTIGPHRRLVARVAEGVQDAAEDLIAQGGTPGKLLADAWQKVHRLDPDDSGAYADAVRAVEAASFDALGIDNSKGNARLGQVIVKIRKDETWRPPFEREHPHHPVNQTLVGMLRTLWVGHRDRHGKADYTNVTHEEAEAAVTLAVTLVGWFTSGAVKQREQPEQFDG